MPTLKLSSSVKTLVVICVLSAAGCAEQPLGPTVDVMPAPNKPFDVFQGDQASCKQYADQQTAGEADRANQKGVGEAVVATALGVGLGAAVGGHQGAGVGAAAGGIIGADVGSQSSGRAESKIQHQYNIAYSQCMYSKGDQVVQYRPRVYAQPRPYYAPQPYPPPPPGYYYPAPQPYPSQAYPPPPGPNDAYPPNPQ